LIANGAFILRKPTNRCSASGPPAVRRSRSVAIGSGREYDTSIQVYARQPW
jgi:hypothetical protein